MGVEGLDQFEQLVDTLRSARVHRIAGQPELAVPALAESLRMIRKMRGHLSAQLAQSIAQTRDASAESWGDTAREASVEAWKQAVQLAPEEPRFVAGYAYALLNADRATEALQFLRAFIDDGGHILHPRLMLIYVLVLKQLDENDNAHKAAVNALELFQANPDLTEQDAAALVGFLLQMKDLASAQAAVQTGLEVFPASRDLLALLAKVQFGLGHHEEAATSAYASQAVAACGSLITEKPAPDQENNDVFETIPLPHVLDEKELRRLLVECLETMQVWDVAYQERMVLLENEEHVSPEDLKSLAKCAAGAERFEAVIEICEKLLLEDPNDITSHRQLAEASEALKDYELAMAHYNQAIQLTPEQGSLWKGLVRVQLKSGQEAGAFETLRAASQALPEDPEIQFQLGEQYLKQEAPTLALPHFRRAYALTEVNGVSGPVAYRLGETLYKLGRRVEAREVLEPTYVRFADHDQTTAGETMDEHNGEIANALALTYARVLLSLDEPEKAVPILTRIVRDYPETFKLKWIYQRHSCS